MIILDVWSVKTFQWDAWDRAGDGVLHIAEDALKGVNQAGLMRSGPVYTFMLSGRRKPASVNPKRSDNSMASEDGAPTAAMKGIDAATAF
jgi:hypothetical protein